MIYDNTMQQSMVDKLNTEKGLGFIDFQNFGRFTLSRANLVFCKPHYSKKTDNFQALGFTIILSGEMHLQYANLNDIIKIKAGEVWWRKGVLENLTTHVPAQDKLQVLSIDFQKNLLNKLAEDSLLSPSFMRLTESLQSFCWERIEVSEKILIKSHQLLQLPSISNELERLQLEGETLSLLVDILKRKSHNVLSFHQENIEMAKIILTSECHKKITIRELSKRVGINECTLKREFKLRYQMTIGEFIRERRMLLAMELLTNGYSLQHVAEKTGYSSKHYFSFAFKQHFGYLPARKK